MLGALLYESKYLVMRLNYPSKIVVQLIEDDVMLVELVQSFLEKNKFIVEISHSAEAFFLKDLNESCDIIICDINLPDLSGWELCKRVRETYSGPFVFLTARSEDEDQIRGLEIGADDYIKKPIRPALLIARIKALLKSQKRFSVEKSPENVISLDDFFIDRTERILKIFEKIVPLTTDEFDLLWLLASNHGVNMSRELLFKLAVGREYNGQERTIDGRVSRLRKKFNSINGNRYEIKTVWRKGYLFANKDRG